jgi:TetR/AcrR family transcriptional regulator, transcriptional repressor of bet genes
VPKLGMETLRRRQIVDAVVKIIEERGWNDLTFQQISSVAGISTGVVVHYFGNKRDMVLDAVAEAGDGLERNLQDIRKVNSRADVRLSALNALLAAPTRHKIPGPKFWITLLANSAFDPQLHLEMERVMTSLSAAAAETFQLGSSQGVFRLARPGPQIAQDYVTLVLGLWSADLATGTATEQQRTAALARFTGNALGARRLKGTA